jgi:ABC-type lipoprotein export system ATPase subunit
MVKLAGIGRRYGAVAPVVALRAIDLEVHAGEWVAVVGASGSGKTTLLNILGCLDRQSSGTYWFDGIDVAALTDRQRAGLRSRRIGFVFQSFHLLAHRTVLENVTLAEAYARRPRAGRADRARAALAAVGLESRTHFLPTRLSGGERQRVAIARAAQRSGTVAVRRAGGQPRLRDDRCDPGTARRAPPRRPHDRHHHPRLRRGRAGGTAGPDRRRPDRR